MKTSFRAGAARIDISPPAGIDLTGFIGRIGPNTGIHDPLSARALVLDDGGTTLLIIACDLMGLDAGAVAGLRAAIESATGIAAAHIMISCSHTHAAPASIFLRNSGDINNGYMMSLPQKVIAVTQAAVQELRPAQLAAGHCLVDGISLNRRRSDGPLDTRLQVLRITGAENTGTIATLMNFACHPITTGPGNRLVSADYPGIACAAIESAEGGVALFINGACGDINPVTASPFLDCRDGSFDTVKHNGLALAAAATKLQDTLQPLAYEPLHAQSQWLDLPLMEAPAEPELRAAAMQQYADLAEPVRNADDCPWRQAQAQLQWTIATLKEYQLGSLRKSVQVEIQVLTFFGIAVVGIPGELFSALGQSLCCGSRSVQTLVATYTNGNIGYIAPREEYAEPGYEIGGAHIFYGYPAALAPGAGETMVVTAQRLIGAAATTTT